MKKRFVVRNKFFIFDNDNEGVNMFFGFGAGLTTKDVIKYIKMIAKILNDNHLNMDK